MSYYIETKEIDMSGDAQTLLDRELIRDVRYQFGWALDTRDWDLFTSLFTEEVDVDLPAFGVPAGTMPRDTLVGLFQHAFRRSTEQMSTQQLYGNMVVDLDGETANARTFLVGHHHVAGMAGGENVELRAVYLDRFVRTSDGWKIRGTALQVQSIVGNAAIFA